MLRQEWPPGLWDVRRDEISCDPVASAGRGAGSAGKCLDVATMLLQILERLGPVVPQSATSSAFVRRDVGGHCVGLSQAVLLRGSVPD